MAPQAPQGKLYGASQTAKKRLGVQRLFGDQRPAQLIKPSKPVAATSTVFENEQANLSSPSLDNEPPLKKLKPSQPQEEDPTAFTATLADRTVKPVLSQDVPQYKPMIIDEEPIASKVSAIDHTPDSDEQARVVNTSSVLEPSSVTATNSVDVCTIFEPKIHYAHGKLNIDACLYSAILQTTCREGGDDSTPLYGSKYWVFVNSIISLAHQLFEKDLMHLNLTIILLCLISEAMKDENDFNFACLNGLVEKQLDGDDYGWEIDTEFMDWCVEDQINMLIEWREMLVDKARHLHSRLSYCIVHLSGYSFNADYKGFKPDIDFIEEAEDVFPEYLLPLEEEKRVGQVGTDGEPLSDSDEEDDSNDVDEDWNDGVKCAQDENEGVEDLYD